MFTAFIWSQILVGIAFVTDGVSWQCKSRKKILALLTISCLLIGTHFYLLEQDAGTAMLAVAAARFFTGIFSTHDFWKWFFVVLTIALGAYTYKNGVDLLAILANLIFAQATFCSQDKLLRQWTMLGTMIFITYNILIFTPMGVFLEVWFLMSNLLGYYRFYIHSPKE